MYSRRHGSEFGRSSWPSGREQPQANGDDGARSDGVRIDEQEDRQAEGPATTFGHSLGVKNREERWTK